MRINAVSYVPHIQPVRLLKLLLLALCILTLGLVLAVHVLRVDLGDALGSGHKIANDAEHVYSPPSHRPSATQHE